MIAKQRILLVEDDADLGNIFMQFLRLHQFEVIWLKDGAAAQKQVLEPFDLCLLDVNLPHCSGFDLARLMRNKQVNTPVIFITARTQKEDRLQGLRLGAVDYITKPFEADELVLKINNLLVRPSNPITKKSIGAYEFDRANLELLHGKQKIQLTEKEADILAYLLQHQGEIVKKEAILEQFWGEADYFTRRSLDVFITRLRKHLAKDEKVQIVSIRSVGIRLEVN